MNSRGFSGDFIGVREDYASWIDAAYQYIERIVDLLPDEWYGWEPSNEFLRRLDDLRAIVREREALIPQPPAPRREDADRESDRE